MPLSEPFRGDCNFLVNKIIYMYIAADSEYFIPGELQNWHIE
jgi:hypothetical protein